MLTKMRRLSSYLTCIFVQTAQVPGKAAQSNKFTEHLKKKEEKQQQRQINTLSATCTVRTASLISPEQLLSISLPRDSIYKQPTENHEYRYTSKLGTQPPLPKMQYGKVRQNYYVIRRCLLFSLLKIQNPN